MKERGTSGPAALPKAEVIDIQAVYEDLKSGRTDLICVLGPTASGKTRYAVNLARQLDALIEKDNADPARHFAHCEILSADSRQVYRGMDIGTGKDIEEYGEVPYHLIDIAEPGTQFTLYDFQQAFRKVLADIQSRHCVPILCGGTGLYIEAVVSNYGLAEIPADNALREQLEAEDMEILRAKLTELRGSVPDDARDNKRRLIRAIEVATWEAQNGPAPRSNRVVPQAHEAADGKEESETLRTYFIGTLVSREERNHRIDARLDKRMEEGMTGEIRGLLDAGVPADVLISYGLEYKYVTQHILGQTSLSGMREKLGIAIHQFAKRQMTWFRGMERRGHRIHWTDTLPETTFPTP